MKVAPCISSCVALCVYASSRQQSTCSLIAADSQPSRVVCCWFSGGKIYITTQHPIRALFSSLKSRRVEWGGGGTKAFKIHSSTRQGSRITQVGPDIEVI